VIAENSFKQQSVKYVLYMSVSMEVNLVLRTMAMRPDKVLTKVPTDVCPRNLQIETSIPRLCKVVDLPTEILVCIIFLAASWKFAVGLPNHLPPINFALS